MSCARYTGQACAISDIGRREREEEQNATDMPEHRGPKCLSVCYIVLRLVRARCTLSTQM